MFRRGACRGAANFFPEHGLGLVVLANAQGANAFSSAIQRKLVELVLGGRPEAEERLRFAAERAEKAAERAEAKLSDPLEDGWAEPLLGRYENDALGQLEIRRERGGVVVDAGEWAARAERYTSADSSTLMVVGPPVAGLSLLPQDDGSLLLDVGQQRYVFARAD